MQPQMMREYEEQLIALASRAIQIQSFSDHEGAWWAKWATGPTSFILIPTWIQ